MCSGTTNPFRDLKNLRRNKFVGIGTGAGSTGYQPVPSGHWPDGTAGRALWKWLREKFCGALPIPRGRLPRGTGGSPVLPVLNPNGIPSLSPAGAGLRAGRYPGSTSQPRPNPDRVASHPRRALAQRFNPFRVDDSSSRPPRVAPASQPRAEGCNPFGIGGERVASRPLFSASRRKLLRAGRMDFLHALGSSKTSRRDADWGDRDGRAPHFHCMNALLDPSLTLTP